MRYFEDDDWAEDIWLVLTIIGICVIILSFLFVLLSTNHGRVNEDCRNAGGTYIEGKCLDIDEIGVVT